MQEEWEFSRGFYRQRDGGFGTRRHGIKGLSQSYRSMLSIIASIVISLDEALPHRHTVTVSPRQWFCFSNSTADSWQHSMMKLATPEKLRLMQAIDVRLGGSEVCQGSAKNAR